MGLMITWPRVRDRTADLNNEVVPDFLGKQSDYFRSFLDLVKGCINIATNYENTQQKTHSSNFLHSFG